MAATVKLYRYNRNIVINVIVINVIVINVIVINGVESIHTPCNYSYIEIIISTKGGSKKRMQSDQLEMSSKTY